MAASSRTCMEDKDGALLSQSLNRDCFCVTLDRDALAAAIAEETGDPGFFPTFHADRPHLFANTSVFMSKTDLSAMMSIVRAISAATELDAYRAAVMRWAPQIAQFDFGPVGVFMGFDFHLDAAGPKLIEINTNAGGAFLNAMLSKAQQACCAVADGAKAPQPHDDFESAVILMFEAEWARQRGTGRFRRIAIVDDRPSDQYLYPEFILAKRLFQRHDIDPVIVDAARLSYVNGALTADGREIDLVYNRLVDFSFSEEHHVSLRNAYLDGAVVVTPNPRNHAIFADKRNLILLSASDTLRAWGLDQEAAERLSGIPRTSLVTHDVGSSLWDERKHLFFKPAVGYGSKAVYRGDKLTKRAWADILAGEYVAQEFAAPSERMVRIDGEPAPRKLDIRLYVYGQQPLLAAARLYQGQTTNFRTQGGGFAPIFIV